MTLQPSRCGFITGLIAFAAAPAIVRASSLMPVKAADFDPWKFDEIQFLEGMSQRMMATILYGNEDFTPLSFSGFATMNHEIGCGAIRKE